jgi:hypothetical protein
MEETTMKEITDLSKPAQWMKLSGILLGIYPSETVYGHKDVCVIKTDDTGEEKQVYKTRSMSALTEKYVGCRIILVRKPLPDGRSRIHVYVDDRTPPAPTVSEDDIADYDPFVEEV